MVATTSKIWRASNTRSAERTPRNEPPASRDFIGAALSSAIVVPSHRCRVIAVKAAEVPEF
jgi:hypothetical protein